MKDTIIGSVIILSGILTSQIVQAQGTMTYLSNLGQASAGTIAVGSNSWVAAAFNTGTNTAGYVINSVQLAMADASGDPSGFTVFLYSAGLRFGPPMLPIENLGTFSSSLDPTTAGIYTFTAISNLMLLPNTFYFIVLTAGTTIANGAYDLSYAGVNSYNSVEGWGNGGGSIYTSGNGAPVTASWGFTSDANAQYAIDATAIPEPGVLGLLSLGG